MGKPEDTWDQKKPQVYQFLEKLIEKPKNEANSKPSTATKQEQKVVIEHPKERKSIEQKKLPEIVQLPSVSSKEKKDSSAPDSEKIPLLVIDNKNKLSENSARTDTIMEVKQSTVGAH